MDAKTAVLVVLTLLAGFVVCSVVCVGLHDIFETMAAL